MSTEQIFNLLIEERDRLEAAIAALEGPSVAHRDVDEDPTMPDWVKPKAKVAPAPKKKGISAASRRKMAEGQKRRWAAINAAKAESVAPKLSGSLAAIVSPPEDAEFKSKMSAAMKASLEKRKKATAANAPVAPKKKTAAAKSAAISKKMPDRMKARSAKRKKAAKK